MVAFQEFVDCKFSQTNSDQDPEILIHSMGHPPQLQPTSGICSWSSAENFPAAIEININFHDDQSCTGCSKRSCTGSSTATSQNDMPGREDPKEAKGEAKLLSLPSLRTEFIECDANGDLKWKEVEIASDLACNSENTICKSSSCCFFHLLFSLFFCSSFQSSNSGFFSLFFHIIKK